MSLIGKDANLWKKYFELIMWNICLLVIWRSIMQYKSHIWSTNGGLGLAKEACPPVLVIYDMNPHWNKCPYLVRKILFEVSRNKCMFKSNDVNRVSSIFFRIKKSNTCSSNYCICSWRNLLIQVVEFQLLSIAFQLYLRNLWSGLTLFKLMGSSCLCHWFVQHPLNNLFR